MCTGALLCLETKGTTKRRGKVHDDIVVAPREKKETKGFYFIKLSDFRVLGDIF